MSSQRRQQKKAEQKKKQRDLLKKEKRKAVASSSSAAAMSKLAVNTPFVAAYLSKNYLTDGDELITAAVSRRIPGFGVVTGAALIDRRCLGVKNGMLFNAERWVQVREAMAENPDIELIEVDLLTAQSVLYHALDYAKSLGFAPHRDFPEGFFAPRPATLLDTPLARPTRPLYVSGPDDRVNAIIAQLTRSVGVGNFDVLALGDPRALSLAGGIMGMDESDDGDDDDDDDADVVDTVGEEVKTP